MISTERIYMKKARKKLEDVYKIIYKNDPDTHKKVLEELNSLSDSELKKLILEDKIYIYVKPFKQPALKDIKEFADYLGIELDERLVLPSHGNLVTENVIPVGLIDGSTKTYKIAGNSLEI